MMFVFWKDQRLGLLARPAAPGAWSQAYRPRSMPGQPPAPPRILRGQVEGERLTLDGHAPQIDVVGALRGMAAFMPDQAFADLARQARKTDRASPASSPDPARRGIATRAPQRPAGAAKSRFSAAGPRDRAGPGRRR